MHEEVLYAVRALRAGAAGYIIKQDAIDNIATALRQVLDGERYVSPSIAGQMIAKSGVGLASGDGGDPTAVLSDRELEILELIGRGQEVRDIAKELELSPKTVEAHRAHIKSKLNLQNARQVARFAVQWVYGQSNRPRNTIACVTARHQLLLDLPPRARRDAGDKAGPKHASPQRSAGKISAR